MNDYLDIFTETLRIVTFQPRRREPGSCRGVTVPESGLRNNSAGRRLPCRGR